MTKQGAAEILTICLKSSKYERDFLGGKEAIWIEVCIREGQIGTAAAQCNCTKSIQLHMNMKYCQLCILFQCLEKPMYTESRFIWFNVVVFQLF